jgi:CheY-like chemotaxis protein
MSATDARHTTVLLIEDDSWIRSLLSELLPAEGYSIEEATNGVAGVRLAKERQPDVVILDLAMPEMSGTDVLRELKSDGLTADIPIIIVSSNTNCLQSGDAHRAAAVMQKPFDVDELIAHVERATSMTE